MRLTQLVSLTIILLLSAQISAKEFYSVISENGLVVRHSPSVTSPVVSVLIMGTKVSLIDRMTEEVDILIDNELVNGHWMLVEYEWDTLGYVFDAFLLENVIDYPTTTCNGDYFTCNTKISFDDYDVLIYSYQIQDSPTSKGDSILAYEDVFNNINDQLIQIKSPHDIDSATVSIKWLQEIFEQYNRENSDSSIEDWMETCVHWKRYSNPFILTRSRQFYRVPIIDYERIDEKLKVDMNLRDTLVNLSGEMDDIATLVYKEKACNYFVDHVVLQFDVYFGDGHQETNYLKIFLSYGC